jgi:hypothetical protein
MNGCWPVFQPVMKARILIEVADRAEAAAADGLAFDDADPDLDQRQPRSGGRGAVDADARVRRQPVAGMRLRVA